MESTDKYLEETYFFDYNSEAVQTQLHKAIKQCTSDVDRLNSWYLYVRDNWIYDPYTIYLKVEKFKASDICHRKSCHCVDKTILFISGLRSIGIPCRIHLAKVKNHISADRIIEKLGTDELAPHGYASVYFNDKWTKASPIFDKNLCKFLNVDPLDYDGNEDSIFQEFDKDGGKFMEYLLEYGQYADLPYDRIKEILITEYPKFAAQALGSGKEVMKF